VIAFGEPYSHLPSQQALLGDEPTEELLLDLSNEKQVTKETPPTFLFHTDGDNEVLADNSVAFYMALRKAGVPAELHIYRGGWHGLALAQKMPGIRAWPEACIKWLQVSKFL